MAAGERLVGSNLKLDGYLQMDDNIIYLGLSNQAYIETTVTSSSFDIANSAGDINLIGSSITISDTLTLLTAPALDNSEDDVLVLLPSGNVGRRSAATLGSGVNVDGITIDFNTAGELTVIGGGGGENLDQTLTIGNLTGSNDIIIDTTTGVRLIRTNNTTSDNRYYIEFSPGGLDSDAIIISRNNLGNTTEGGYGLYEGGAAEIGYSQPGEGPDVHTLSVDDVGYKRFLFTSNGGTCNIDIEESVRLRLERSGFFSELRPLNLTANRFHFLQDANGTIAHLTDIPQPDGVTIDYNTAGELTVIGGGGGENLEQTLAIGNQTGSNNIIVNSSQSIQDSTGGGQLKLGGFATNYVALTTDNDTYATDYIFLDPGTSGIEMYSTQGYNIISDGDIVLDGAVKIKSGLFSGELLPTTLTVNRTYTFQDASGIVAFLSDIPQPDGVTIDYNTAGELTVLSAPTFVRTWTWSGGTDSNVTNSYLRIASGPFSNLTSFIVPFNCEITAISAGTDGAETWTAEVHVNGSNVASVSIVAADNGYTNGLSVSVSAGDKVSFYCNGSVITRPVITAWFNEV